MNTQSVLSHLCMCTQDIQSLTQAPVQHLGHSRNRTPPPSASTLFLPLGDWEREINNILYHWLQVNIIKPAARLLPLSPSPSPPFSLSSLLPLPPSPSPLFSLSSLLPLLPSPSPPFSVLLALRNNSCGEGVGTGKIYLCLSRNFS